MADTDVRIPTDSDTPKGSAQATTTEEFAPAPKLTVDDQTPPPPDSEGMEELSPMRTHEMHSGHEKSVADRMSHLVDDLSDSDGEGEKQVNHEKLERKEMRRQKTSDKPNRLRDRLKRTVSKAAEN